MFDRAKLCSYLFSFERWRWESCKLTKDEVALPQNFLCLKTRSAITYKESFWRFSTNCIHKFMPKIREITVQKFRYLNILNNKLIITVGVPSDIHDETKRCVQHVKIIKNLVHLRWWLESLITNRATMRRPLIKVPRYRDIILIKARASNQASAAMLIATLNCRISEAICYPNSEYRLTREYLASW